MSLSESGYGRHDVPADRRAGGGEKDMDLEIGTENRNTSESQQKNET